MRISDWSSDVCSSDLSSERPWSAADVGAPVPAEQSVGQGTGLSGKQFAPAAQSRGLRRTGALAGATGGCRAQQSALPGRVGVARRAFACRAAARSDERRVGKECVSESRTRWALDLKKKKTKTITVLE